MPINTWDPTTGIYYDASGNPVDENTFYAQQTAQKAQRLQAAAPPTSGHWDPVTGNYYDAQGNQVDEDTFYRNQTIYNAQRLGISAPFTPTPGQVTPQTDAQGNVLYNMGNGLMGYVPPNDPRFMPAPQLNNGLFSGGLSDDLSQARGGLGVMATALGGALFAGAGAAGGLGTDTTMTLSEQIAAQQAAGAAAGSTAGAADASTTLYPGESANAGAATYPNAGPGYSGAADPYAGLNASAGSSTPPLGNTATASGATGTGSSNMGYFDDFTGQWVDGTQGAADTSGVDLSRSTDPSYWNPQGGTTGLAEPGAAGIDPGTASYGGSGLLQQAKDLAAQFGITPASALKYLASAAGRAAPAALGAVAANQQANAFRDLNSQYLGFGAPSRARYEASFQPGFTMANEPGYQDALDQVTKSTLHGLSVQGNPAGSPNAWNQTLSDVNAKFAFPALQNYRNQNANTGGIGALTSAAPGAATNAIGAQGGVYNAIGAGINDIFNPPKSLAQQLAEMKQAGVF